MKSTQNSTGQRQFINYIELGMFKSLRVLTICILTSLGSSGIAEVAVHGLFTDNMVLQRNVKLPVYGTGKDGEMVSVSFAGQEVKGTVVNGAWKVWLEPMMATAQGQDLVIVGTTPITFKNVLVGDVWICGGQSNMFFPLLGYENMKQPYWMEVGSTYDLKYTNDRLRLFMVAKLVAKTPNRDVITDKDFGSSWQVCGPQYSKFFSAVGYFFGQKLLSEIEVPVGLIQSCVGGSPVQAWMNSQSIDKANVEFETAMEYYDKKREPGEKSHPRPPSLIGGKAPCVYYNAMIAPLQEFPIRGVIWYQGEANSYHYESAIQYRSAFKGLISQWREDWQCGDFPFIFVMLAGFSGAKTTPSDSTWAWVREAQAKALSLPNTGMALALDYGLEKDVHPPAKKPVGERLAMEALRVAYGKPITSRGPMFKTMKIEGDKAIVSFESAGSDLEAREVALGLRGIHKIAAGTLKGFAICGSDQVFFDAESIIKGNVVEVSSTKVKEPLAVRYAWASFPLANLYNKAGFPAIPFRTDDFPPPVIPLRDKKKTVNNEPQENQENMSKESL